MHRAADEVRVPVRDHRPEADDDGDDPVPGRDARDSDGGVEENDDPGPPDRASPRFGPARVERLEPLRPVECGVAPECGADESPDVPRHAPGVHSAGHVHGEELEEVERRPGRSEREHHFPIPARMQRVEVVVGMAHPVLVVVPPCEDAVDPEKEGIQPLRPEHGAVPELVAAIVQVRGHRPVREEGEGEPEPHLGKEAVDGQCARAGRDREVAAGLEPALRVASFGQLAQPLGLDGAAVPVDPARVD